MYCRALSDALSILMSNHGCCGLCQAAAATMARLRILWAVVVLSMLAGPEPDATCCYARASYRSTSEQAPARCRLIPLVIDINFHGP
jgi:hypothetical protein